MPPSSSSQPVEPSAEDMIEYWEQRRELLITELRRSLEATLFSSRVFVRPAMLPEIARDEAAALIQFAASGDAQGAMRRGKELCQLGLSTEAILDMTGDLRTYYEKLLPPNLGLRALQQLEDYHRYLLQGFVAEREQLLLKEQEHIRSALQRSLNAYTVQLQTAGEVARVATAILDLDILLTTSVLLIHERFDLPFVGIYLLDEDGQTLTLKASRGKNNSALPVATQVQVTEDSIIATAVRRQERSIKTTLLADDADRVSKGMALAVPLSARDKAIGALLLHSERLDAFSSQEEHTFRIIADQLTTAIENAKLYEEVQQRAAELAQANKQLQELDLMKTHFIQNVSHELRTPLAVIIGYVDLLLSGQLGEPLEAQREALAIINHSANTLNDLVLDIMSIVEIQGRQIHTERVDPIFVTRQVLTDLKLMAQEKEITFQIDLPPRRSFPHLDAAPNHFRRVVSNLLSNAIKFSNIGTEVTVRLGQKDGYVYLSVSDQGIGLTPEQCQHVFDRFYRTDSSLGNVAGGTGLGLALVKEIVEVHGGRVEAESAGLGKGTTFRVWWPIPDAHASE